MWLVTRVLLFICCGMLASRCHGDDSISPAVTYETLDIQGWQLKVHPQLRSSQPSELETALKLLDQQLTRLVAAVPEAKVVWLKTVPLWFSPEYPGVGPRAEYHPGEEWLREHRRNPEMVRGVEFTNISIFSVEDERMPMLVLHELAHAYHHQVLTYDHAELNEAFQQAAASGTYNAVRRSNGQTEQAYAMTNVQEYFAESTEAFFGKNDFFPFQHDELKSHDPVMWNLLGKLWGLPRGQAVKETE